MKSCAAVAILGLILAGCGTTTKEPTKPEAPPEPVTGLHALYQMFAASHAWAPDAQVYRLDSIAVADIKLEPGKAPAWQAVFVSPSLQQSKTYTYSVSEVSMSLHKGINSGKAEGWRQPNASMQPFPIAAAKIDSDEAYETAMKKGAAFNAKHPGMPMMFQLALTSSYTNAAWRVLWGESASTSPYSVLIDATTGAYVETLH